MLATTLLTVAAAFIGSAVAAPLEKRGGFWQEGNWVDDGYYTWAKGEKDVPFTPWAKGGKPDYATATGTTDASQAQATKDAYSSNDGSFSYYGSATYFYQNGVAGNCGSVHSDSDHIVALQSGMYAGGSHCGKKIIIKNAATGAVATATVADSCPTCVSSQSIDLSESLFESLGSKSQGVLSVQWGWA